MDSVLADIKRRPALQQPQWPDLDHVHSVSRDLITRPALVDAADVLALQALLAQVAAGTAHVVQAGDCAEDPAECTMGYVARKAALLDLLAGTMKMSTHRPVLRAGRIAGQYVKPRTSATDWVAGVELPAYRGHLVNSPEPDPVRRRPDPDRMLTAYEAAGEVMRHLGWSDQTDHIRIDPPIWTSHEALLLDYELALLRRDEQGRLLLGSTHWPWIGERTRQLDGAHVALLAAVINPVACKVGPTMTAEDLLLLCQRLDPHRQAGRLTLIVRMGAEAIANLLPPLVTAVHDAGHPVIWLCDPMHGNTIKTASGLKTRVLGTIIREVQAFQYAVRQANGTAGGLHLETTPDDVTECVHDESGAAHVEDKYTTLCDPRLNPDQAVSIVSAWSG